MMMKTYFPPDHHASRKYERQICHPTLFSFGRGLINILPFCLQTEEDSASTLVKKEEPEEKPEPMEVGEKKPEIKTEPKEEEEGGASSTTSSSPSQSRRKSESDDEG